MNRLLNLLSLTAVLIAALPAFAQEKVDFKNATLQIVTDSDGRSELRLWLGRSNCKEPAGILLIFTTSSELFNPDTHAITLNKTVEIVNERNGFASFDWGDTGEPAHSTTVRFSRIKGSRIWGEYRTTTRNDKVWEGSFVARLCSQSR